MNKEFKMNSNHQKLIAIILFVLPLMFAAVFGSTPVSVAATAGDDPAAAYKAKCAACHLPNASKFYDPAKAEDVHIETILKGRKGEKPPYMPGFEAKGMTTDEAKGLATYMKGLRASAK
jgi:mono/diheme cytochrome c family protein